MELKLFGRSLFEVKKSISQNTIYQVNEITKTSKFLPDFYKGFENNSLFLIKAVPEIDPVDIKSEKTDEGKKITPKDVYTLKMLHDENFTIKVDPKYVDGQISDFRNKLNLIKSEEYDMMKGVNEIASILMRFENRKKYPETAGFFEQYPYTTTIRIEDLMKKHNHLRIGQVASFLADMPKEASDTMMEYNENTKLVCDKQAVFYIIAEKKDFERTSNRRDPILLAQSPFGHFWQILGAWDKEMLLVDEL